VVRIGVIATAAIGVGVSLIAAPAASAQTDCTNSATVPIGPVCTLPQIVENYVSTPQQFAEGFAAQPGEIAQGVTNWVAFPGQVVEAWTHPFTPFGTTSTTLGTNLKKK
jgi:hypothetical protein